MQQGTLPFITDTGYDAHAYLTDATNEDIRATFQNYAYVTAPGIFLSGPKKSGKTHLAHIWPYFPMARFIDTLSLGDDFLMTYMDRPTPIVLKLDSLLSLQKQSHLFHLFNAMKAAQQPLLILSTHSLPNLNLSLKDLDSRLKTLLHLSIPPLSEDLMEGILHKRFSDLQIHVDSKVTAFILPRLPRTYEALGSLISYIDRSIKVEKRAVTIPLVRGFLEEFNS